MSNAAYEKAWEKRLRALGVSAERVEAAALQVDSDGRTVYDIRFKLDADDGTGVLAILKATGPLGAQVAFVGGSTYTEVILAVGKKLGAGTVRWREDRPFGA